MYSNQGDDDIRTLVQNNGFASRGLAKQVLPIAKDKEEKNYALSSIFALNYQNRHCSLTQVLPNQ